MLCLVAALLVLGPRAMIVIWWLTEPVRWGQAFDTFIVPLLGFIFLPWTTLAYVLVFPAGVEGVDWLALGLAFVVDVIQWGGGAYTQRDRFVPEYRQMP